MDWNWLKEVFELTRRKESKDSIEFLVKDLYFKDKKIAGACLRNFPEIQENHNTIVIDSKNITIINNQICKVAYIFEEIETSDDYKLKYVIYRGDPLQIIPVEQYFEKIKKTTKKYKN